MTRIKLNREYLKKVKVNVSGDYIVEVDDVRANELVSAGNAEYLDKPVEEVKEVKNKKTKVMTPRKKRTYSTK